MADIVPLDSADVHDPLLPDPVFRSYARLLARAWDGQAARAVAYTEDELRALFAGAKGPMTRSTMYLHLRELRLARRIAWRTDGAGRYHVTFPPRPGNGGTTTALPTQPHTARPALESASPKVRTRAKSELSDSVVVVKDIPPLEIDQTTPTAQSENSDFRTRAAILERLGLWPDAAAALAEAGVDPAQALGWAAYCADPARAIANPAALLAANLRAGRPAPAEYLPPRFCRRCDRALDPEGRCACLQAPDPWLPVAALLAALADPPGPDAGVDRWGVCPACRALDCQCEETGD